MLLHYIGADYEDEIIDNYEIWGEKKFTLGLDFPNLPYFFDGDLKLTQSNTIIRHLGRHNNLYGKNSNEIAQIDMLMDTAFDFKTLLGTIAYNPDFVITLIVFFH